MPVQGMTTAPVVVNWILSILGGGVVGAVISAMSSARSERRSRRATYVKEQLQCLYGPLHFLTSQNESYFNLCNKILGAGRKAYGSGSDVHNTVAHDAVSNEIRQTIDLSNEYVGIVIQNNERIFELLQQAYCYIDPEDISVFSQLVVDHVRLKTEQDEHKQSKIPLRIHLEVGEVSFMRNEFIHTVHDRFLQKKAELARLTGTSPGIVQRLAGWMPWRRKQSRMGPDS